MVFADARALSTLEAGRDFVELSDDGALLLCLCLLGVFNGTALVVLVHVQVLGITTAATISTPAHALIASKITC